MGDGVGLGVGEGVGLGVGEGVGLGVGDGVGLGVGDGVGLGVGDGVGLGVGDGVTNSAILKLSVFTWSRGGPNPGSRWNPTWTPSTSSRTGTTLGSPPLAMYRSAGTIQALYSPPGLGVSKKGISWTTMAGGP